MQPSLVDRGGAKLEQSDAEPVASRRRVSIDEAVLDKGHEEAMYRALGKTDALREFTEADVRFSWTERLQDAQHAVCGLNHVSRHHVVSSSSA
jgi:hypothetical protein